MLLNPSDNYVAKQITFYYCLSTCFVLTTLIILHYRTEYYLYAGKNEIIPLLIFFLIFEIFKWLYHRFVYEKDIRATSIKKRIQPVYKVFFKSLDVVHLVKTVVATIVGTFVFFILSFLFGVRIVEKYHETLLFSILMSILTVFQLCLNLGVGAVVHLMSGYRPNNMFHWLIQTNIKLTLLGAWAGAVLSPLDWDRPWQVWPVPSAFGALTGYIASHYLVYTEYFIFPSFFNKNK